MQLHLVDATYELFRAHFAPRPDVIGRDGIVLSGVSGLCDQLLYLLREEGATHVGCATDRVIESFRNDLYPGYKSSAGHAAGPARPVPHRGSRHRGPRRRALADGRVRGRRCHRGGRRALRRGRARRTHPRVHPGQGHGPARPRRADRAVGSPPRDHLRRCRRPCQVGRATAVDPRLAGPGGRFIGRVPGPARLGSERGGRDPGTLRTLRGHPRKGVGLGGTGRRGHSGGRTGRDPARTLGRGAPVPGSRATAHRRGWGPDPPAGRRRAALGRCAARQRGRRSARSGVWTGSGPDRTAGSTRTEPPPTSFGRVA